MLGTAFLLTAETCVPISSPSSGIRVLAFNLHQACEAFFNAILALVTPTERRSMKAARAEAEDAATSAAVRSHDLAELRFFSALVCPEVRAALPLEADEDARLFELLSSSYIKSRYSERKFHVSAADLEALLERVRQLGDVARACTAPAGDGTVRS
jgi:hypothetical protein